MPTLRDHALALQSIVGDLSTLAVRDLVQLFTQHDDGSDRFGDLLRGAFGEIVRPYARAAGTITAQWYRELLPGNDFAPTPIVDLPDARIDKTVDWALNARGDAKPLDRLAGSSKRMVADASRATVVDNAAQEGIKWARLAAPDACAFCKVLALRGAVYNTYGIAEDEIYVQRTVVVGRNGNPRGKRAVGESYHDHCRCVAVPIRQGQQWNPPDYVSDWQKQYRDAVKEAGGSHDLKEILSKMRAAERARNSPQPDVDEHDLPPVELDTPAIA
ncbi:MAG: hypothetical protein CK431_04365 [Mycobacterium sp.]|nr:MAG: hypothetical protein CK431_04365 [Mycobacterium sp.]